MKRAPNLIFALVFAGLVALGAIVGNHLRDIYESRSFYGWIVSAGTNERLFGQWDDEYRDRELYRDLQDRLEEVAPELTEMVEVEGDEPPVSRLSVYVGDGEHDDELWRLARSEALEPVRAQFVNAVQEHELLLTDNITYADMLEGNVSVFNVLLGFRKVAANFLWLEVDKYWHMGYVHRMIPLMKTCVALDPQFVEAYLLGAWHLAYNVTAGMPDTPEGQQVWSEEYQTCVGEKEEYYYIAADFLKSGTLHNPRNYKLYFDLGFAVYMNKLHDYENAVRFLEQAVRQPHEVWVPRQLFRAYELNGQYQQAVDGWRDYQERFPELVSGSQTAQRFIDRNEALMYEKEMMALRALASQTQDPQVKEQYLEEAAEFRARAEEIWREMDDPFAQGRLLWMEANDLLAQDRAREAIAVLDHARWESNDLFDEASDKIIEIKQEHGFRLSESERLAVLRREMGGECQGKPADVEET